MHVDTKHGHVGSFREFIAQYLMIVVSIITAMGFEQAARAYHNKELAQASQARIKSEIAFNRHELQSALEINRANLKALKTDFDRQVAKMAGARGQAGPSAPDNGDAAKFQVSMPTFRRDAWEAAIADQSVTHLAPAELQKFSEIYSAQKDLTQAAIVLLQGNWQSDAAEMLLAGALGRADPENQVRITARALIILSAVNQNLVQLEETLKRLAPGV